MNLNKNFIYGLVLGALIAAFILMRLHPKNSNEVLAEVQGEALTKQQLHSTIGDRLVPIENDEYAILQMGIKEWMDKRLLEKEAKAQGITLEELYRRDIWSKVKVSHETVKQYYDQNRQLYTQPFDQMSTLLFQQFRYIEFAKQREEYVQQLSSKYNAKIYLKQPASFVEGLAMPQAGGSPPSAASAQQPPANQPAEIKSESGSPASKGPSDAKIKMVEFADFHCPYCKQAKETLDQVFQKYPGQIHWIFRNFPLSATPGTGSFLTHEAAACAKEQGKFWEFHDAIFSRSAPPQPSDLEAIADQIGLDHSHFDECLKSGKYRDAIQADVREGQSKEIQGTPTTLINGQTVGGAYPFDHFVNIIDGILTGKPPAPEPQPTAAAPPAAAVVKFNDLEGRPSSGPADAPITLVEFSDFFCPFCKRVMPTLEDLQKNYSGKIRRVWRHYPLPFHAGSERAHQASECANEQGKFWPYHDKLFEKQGSFSDDASLIHVAKEVGLNQKKFEKCLQSGKYKDLIQKEIAKGGEVGVQGTPAVFVNGKLVSGAQPYENFDRIVKKELAKS